MNKLSTSSFYFMDRLVKAIIAIFETVFGVLAMLVIIPMGFVGLLAKGNEDAIKATLISAGCILQVLRIAVMLILLAVGLHYLGVI